MGNISAQQTGDGKQIIKGGNTNIKIGGTVIIVGILIVVFLFGKGLLSSPKKQIIGTWQSGDGYTYVFNENGQFTSSGGFFGNYSVEGDILTISPALFDPEIYRIKISSDSLTLYSTDGDGFIELQRFK